MFTLVVSQADHCDPPPSHASRMLRLTKLQVYVAFEVVFAMARNKSSPRARIVGMFGNVNQEAVQ
jgi:hypothetical protein